MEIIFQVIGVAIITAIACCAIASQASAVSAALSIAACILISLTTLRFMQPILDVLSRLQTLAGLSNTVMGPVLKVAGIGLLVQIAATVCQDAGEQALCKSVEIAGSIISLYVSLPLITAVLNLLEEILKK